MSDSALLRQIWLAGLTICLIVPTILVVSRMYTKIKIMKRLEMVDYVCFLAWIGFVVLSGLALSLHRFGVGFHETDVPSESAAEFAKIINIHQIIYMPSILFTKVSILLQLLQIFVPEKRTGKWYLIQSLLWGNVIFFTILFFLEIFECTPRLRIWKPLTPGHCINIEQTFVASATINVCSDFSILILPLYWVWQLRLSMERKAKISLVFATGLFACIASIMRLVKSIASINNPDITYTLLPVALWAMAEVSSGLIVSCLPVMPRFMRHIGARIEQSSFGSRSSLLKRKQYTGTVDNSSRRLPLNSSDVESRASSERKTEVDMPHIPKPATLKTMSPGQMLNS